MSLIVIASDKGAPGVTTTAIVLAGVWPRRAILAECDPSGGDLVYRSPAVHGSPLNPNIGMLSLATMARHGLSAHQLGDHLQRIHGGLEVVAGLATGDQSAGLTGLWANLGRAFDGLPGTDVIADCGRVDANSPSLDLMAAAAVIILVARTSAEAIAHVRDRALSLVQRLGGGNAISTGGLGVPIGVVLIVDPKQRTRVSAQVDALLRNSGLPVRVIGTIADDPDGAAQLGGRGRGRLDKTLLIRSSREVALDLYRRFAAPGTEASAPNAGVSVGASVGADAGPVWGMPQPPQGPRPPQSPPPQGPGSEWSNLSSAAGPGPDRHSFPPAPPPSPPSQGFPPPSPPDQGYEPPPPPGSSPLGFRSGPPPQGAR